MNLTRRNFFKSTVGALAAAAVVPLLKIQRYAVGTGGAIDCATFSFWQKRTDGGNLTGAYEHLRKDMRKIYRDCAR